MKYLGNIIISCAERIVARLNEYYDEIDNDLSKKGIRIYANTVGCATVTLSKPKPNAAQLSRSLVR